MNDAQPERAMSHEAPDEKQFHGWRLLGVIGIIVALVGLASLLIDWVVVV